MIFLNHSHKVAFQLANHFNHSRNKGLHVIVYFNFETNMQADLSVGRR